MVECGDGHDRAFVDRGDVLSGCERPVYGYRPAVRRAPVRGSRRTTFRLRWDAVDTSVALEPAGYAPRRPGCRQGSWRVRMRTGEATLRWVGRFPPCPGRYTWRVVATDADGTRVACESGGRLDCARRDVVGEAAFTVGAKRSS